MKKLMIGLVAFAFPVLAAPATDKTLESSFTELGLQVNAVADAPVPGLLQVLTDHGLFWASKDGRYLLEGQVFDMKNKVLVNEQIMNKVRLEGVAKFADSVIEYKAPDQKYVVTVFTDTSCGYCRKLHSELQSYLDAGITIRYLAFPRGGIKSETYEQLQSIWCAKDKQQSMTQAKNGGMIVPRQCQNNVAAQYQLGASFGIQGTPAIVLPDGSMIPGYQPAAALAARLAGKSN